MAIPVSLHFAKNISVDVRVVGFGGLATGEPHAPVPPVVRSRLLDLVAFRVLVALRVLVSDPVALGVLRSGV